MKKDNINGLEVKLKINIRRRPNTDYMVIGEIVIPLKSEDSVIPYDTGISYSNNFITIFKYPEKSSGKKQGRTADVIYGLKTKDDFVISEAFGMKTVSAKLNIWYIYGVLKP